MNAAVRVSIADERGVRKAVAPGGSLTVGRDRHGRLHLGKGPPLLAVRREADYFWLQVFAPGLQLSRGNGVRRIPVSTPACERLVMLEKNERVSLGRVAISFDIEVEDDDEKPSEFSTCPEAPRSPIGSEVGLVIPDSIQATEAVDGATQVEATPSTNVQMESVAVDDIVQSTPRSSLEPKGVNAELYQEGTAEGIIGDGRDTRDTRQGDTRVEDTTGDTRGAIKSSLSDPPSNHSRWSLDSGSTGGDHDLIPLEPAHARKRRRLFDTEKPSSVRSNRRHSRHKEPASASAALSTEPPRIAFSYVAPASIATLTAFLRRCRVQVLDSAAAATHLVVGGAELKRTPKVLVAVAVGAHIVSDTWLKDSAAAGALLDPAPYHVHDESKEGEWRISLAATLQRNRRAPSRVFRGKKLYITPSLAREWKRSGVDADLFELVRICGAEEVSTQRLPPHDADGGGGGGSGGGESIVFSTAEDIDVGAWQKDGWKVYTQNLLFAAVLQGTLDASEMARWMVEP